MTGKLHRAPQLLTDDALIYQIERVHKECVEEMKRVLQGNANFTRKRGIKLLELEADFDVLLDEMATRMKERR